MDWIGDRIYYSHLDSSFSPSHLVVYDLSTGENTDITAAVDEDYALFWDIAVDPMEG